MGNYWIAIAGFVEVGRREAGRDSSEIMPRSIDEEGQLILVVSRDWCSGFFPGCLWYEYEKTGDEHWKSLAENYTELLANEQFKGRTHDMGFKMFCSHGNGYRLTNNPEYRDVLI